jgi:hypothetical protein
MYCVWLRLHDFKWEYEEMTVSSEFFRGIRNEYLEEINTDTSLLLSPAIIYLLNYSKTTSILSSSFLWML